MRDRLPTPGRENRVKITQDDGTIVSGVLAYDDQATQEGSPYTRGNVLPDEVCNAYDLDYVTSEPKDAFLAIPQVMGKARISITVKKINGQPYPGVLVNGLSNIDAPRRTTNSNGNVTVYVDAGTYNLSFQPNPVCVDTSIPSKQAVVSIGSFTSVETQEVSNGLTSLSVTSSRTIAFSANAQNIDIFCVGGGGAGGACIPKHYPNSSPEWACGPSAGGGGGYTATRKNATLSRYAAYSAVVGAGGTATTTKGNDGGNTSVAGVLALGGKAGVTCDGHAGAEASADLGVYDIYYEDILGGNGGSGGGGVGGYAPGNGGSNGDDGQGGSYRNSAIQNGGKGQGSTTTAFGEGTGIRYGAGGGGGGEISGVFVSEGGETGGGNGGHESDPGGDGQQNTGAGGGGTETAHGSSAPVRGGNGGSGIILLRWVNAS